MISHVQPLPSTPPTHISHHLHHLCHLHPISIFQSHLFLSTSSPSSPHSPAHQSIFATIISQFAHPCWPSLQMHAILDHIQVCQLVKLSSMLVGPLLRTMPWRSWTLPVIGHFYSFSYVSLSPFCLSSCAPFQPILFRSFHWTSSYIAVFSTSHPPSHSKPIYSLTLIWTLDLLLYNVTQFVTKSTWTSLALVSFFPFLLTLAHKVQPVPISSKPYKYHCPALLNSRQLQPTSPLFLLHALPTTTCLTSMLCAAPLWLCNPLLVCSRSHPYHTDLQRLLHANATWAHHPQRLGINDPTPL